ncbi:MAG: hypothetical protein LIO90_04430 [Bacteroidales bacterium]|nr:hypothetical protein [Bacteroidales bacterium]
MSNDFKTNFNSTLDIDSIMSTGIPDIATVYGGVRGRTMSSRHQSKAWPVIIQSGVKIIIDLREDGINSRLSGLCKLYGIEYFYYPVDNRGGHVESMVRLLPELCRIIDQGSFYIACAMGLHRTDIALCAYWMFHAADKGIDPPLICGYTKAQGHTTEKIMRVLNGIYDFITTHNGQEPMPKEIFTQRKKIIRHQAGFD